jgi:His/Glu/Gln/Arg/opine family amino acid ABC transporter permease subunit
VEGTIITLQIASVSLLLGMAMGLPLGVLRVYGPPWLQRIVARTSLFQGTPLLMQLFLIYYGLPDLGLTLDADRRLYHARPEQRRLSGGISARGVAIGRRRADDRRARHRHEPPRPSAASSCRRRCGWCCRPGRTK